MGGPTLHVPFNLITGQSGLVSELAYSSNCLTNNILSVCVLSMGVGLCIYLRACQRIYIYILDSICTAATTTTTTRDGNTCIYIHMDGEGCAEVMGQQAKNQRVLRNGVNEEDGSSPACFDLFNYKLSDYRFSPQLLYFI